MRTFWYYYNEPASQVAGKPQITIHYRGACHIVDNFECHVLTWGHIRKEQPRFVVKGRCKEITFINNQALIQ